MSFKSILDKLKLSSREAIVNGEKNSFDALKRYLHVERRVEQDLSDLVISSFQSAGAKLTLVIGNVGDGKSHLLARMWEKHPLEMDTFQVHNDATESLSRHKSYLETLADVLHPYADGEVNAPGNQVKTIIAINLGTLTNFLDEKGDDFQQLKAFIADNHILQDDDYAAPPNRNSPFQFINLADYHLYALEEEGPTSQVLLDIIGKVTDRTERNPFFKAYKDFYKYHPAAADCPLKYNYDLLGQEGVKTKVVQILIEAIVKHKLIVSVRLAMNLIYDLIVPPAFFGLSDEETVEKTKQSKKGFLYKSTLPWLLFDSPSTSTILRHISKLDPMSASNAALDHLVIEMGTTVDPVHHFTDYGVLREDDRLYEELIAIPVLDRIKLFVRVNYLKSASPKLLVPDSLYGTFMKNLYYYHAGHKHKLIALYQNVQKAIYQWNGAMKLEDGYLNLNIGRERNSYKLSQKVQVESCPVEGKVWKEGPLDTFSNSLLLGFKVNREEVPFLVKVDFGLYRLLMSLNQGYRANLVDKSNHVDFRQFVHRLSSFKTQDKEVMIQEFRGERQKRFKLSFTPGFDVFQFEEIQ